MSTKQERAARVAFRVQRRKAERGAMTPADEGIAAARADDIMRAKAAQLERERALFEGDRRREAKRAVERASEWFDLVIAQQERSARELAAYRDQFHDAAADGRDLNTGKKLISSPVDIVGYAVNHLMNLTQNYGLGNVPGIAGALAKAAETLAKAASDEGEQ